MSAHSLKHAIIYGDSLTKVCPQCNRDLPRNREIFDTCISRATGAILYRSCRECTRKYQRAHYHKNPKKQLESSKRWRANNLERAKATDHKKHLRRKFGITPEQYNTLLEQQNHNCAICGGGDKGGRRLSVDHCHGCGEIRGLLCGNCNSAIGQLGDDPQMLRDAISYLESHHEA